MCPIPVTVKKIINFPGGDAHIGNELLMRINAACSGKCTLVEVFGGSGYIAQMADRSKFDTVVYNDINDKLTTFYRMVKENPQELATWLMFLPYARSFNKIIMELFRTGNKELGALETAALLFYAVNSTLSGIGFMGHGGGFAYTIKPGRNHAVAFKSRVQGMLELASRWRDIVIENRDFRDIIRVYDSAYTVFYLDPPFIDRAERYYGTVFTVGDLRDMAQLLTRVEGRFLLKVDDETYEYVKDVLPEGKFKVEKVEETLFLDKRRGKKRRMYVLVFVSNF